MAQKKVERVTETTNGEMTWAQFMQNMRDAGAVHKPQALEIAI